VKRSPLLPIFLIVVVDVLGLTIILPLLPFYAERLGATPTQVGLLVSTYAACQLFSGPLLGRISDRIGRKPLLLVSQVGTLIGFLILARAQLLWVVFLSRVIDGITAGNLSLAQAYIADVTAPKDRARAFGIIGIAFGFGFLVGPGISGLLAPFGYAYPVLLAAGLSFASILATAFLLPSRPPHPEGPPEEGPALPAGRRLSLVDWSAYLVYFRRPKLGSLLWQFFSFTFAFAVFTGGFALFAERRFLFAQHPFGVKEVAYVFSYAGLLGIVLQGGFIGRLVRRFGEPALVMTGFAGGALGYAVLGLSSSIPTLLLATTISSLSMGLLRPTLTSLITQQVGRAEQGVVLGLTQSLVSVSGIAGPALAGALIDRRWLLAWATVAAASSGIGLLIHRASRIKTAGASQKGFSSG